jgi:very-short-patch-repair endonuclease
MPKRFSGHICRHCGEIAAEPTTSAFYCSGACYNAHRITKNTFRCDRCGVEFHRRISGVTYYKMKKDGASKTYCGSQCQREARRSQVAKTCVVCGCSFSVKHSHSEKIRCCSRECSDKSKSAQIEVKCDFCGKEFSVRLGRKDTVRFCSRRCKVHFKGESGLERVVRESLERLGVSYQQEYRVGRRYSVDFFLPEMRVALEADGDYWHAQRKEHDDRRDRWLMKFRGIKTIRIKASEVYRCREIDRMIEAKLAGPEPQKVQAVFMFPGLD